MRGGCRSSASGARPGPSGTLNQSASTQLGGEVADRVTEFLEDFVVGQGESVVGINLFGGVAGDVPTGVGQVLGGRAPLAEPDELGDVDVQSVLTPGVAHRPRAFVGEDAHVGDVLRGQPASRNAE